MQIPVKRRILLVDDDLAVLLSLKAVLQLGGFEADTAASLGEAHIKLESSHYHMVITDMRIHSQKDGFEIIKSARSAIYRPAIAILTAYPELGREWAENGAHCLLVKPVNPHALLCQIEALLIQHEDRKRGHQPIDPAVLQKKKQPMGRDGTSPELTR